MVILPAILQHVWESLTVRNICIVRKTFAKLIHLRLARIRLILLLLGLILDSLLLNLLTMWASYHWSHSLMSHLWPSSKSHSLGYSTANSRKNSSTLSGLRSCLCRQGSGGCDWLSGSRRRRSWSISSPAWTTSSRHCYTITNKSI